MEAASHIIGKQRIHLHYKGITDTIALRQLISKVCSDELPARLNKLLDRYDDKDFVFRIDKLDVHVTINDDGQLEETLAKAIIEQIEAALRQKLEQRVRQSLPTKQSFARTLQFFLQNGYLPWWSLFKDTTSFRKATQQAWNSPDALQEVVHEILPGLHSSHVRNRLIGLLNKEELEAFVAATKTWTSEVWKALLESFAYFRKAKNPELADDTFYRILFETILAVVAGRPLESAATAMLAFQLSTALEARQSTITEETITALPSAVARAAFMSQLHSDAADLLPRPTQNGKVLDRIPQNTKTELPDEIPEPQEGENIFINNAGLVLVAPYLPAFFRNIGLRQDERLEEKHRAIAFLRQLTFAQDTFEEFEIVLEKILCGIPLTHSVEGGYSLTWEEKEQADLLLQSVIEHWNILKNTSPEGLRNSFLQREGKLVFQHEQWNLTVQKQAHDILVNYIPWNFKMIKLPWMPHLLTVHWNN